MNNFKIIIILLELLSSNIIICKVWDDESHDVPQTFYDNDDSLNYDKPNELSLESQQQFEDGKHKYSLLKSESQRYGICWHKAMESLHFGCKQLTDDVQSRLALAFANCFLEKSGQRTYQCDATMDISQCTKEMNDRAFNSYTEFFTHTQSICFFLNNQLWQKRTEETVTRLSRTSAKVSRDLDVAADNLHQMKNLQHISIDTQISLNEELMNSRNLMKEFKINTEEQRFIVKEILDRFVQLQDFVLIELSYGYTIAFFFISMITVFLLTTHARTIDARLWLFAILICQVFIEKFIASYSMSADDSFIYGMETVSKTINERIWIMRKVIWIMILAVLLWFAFTYKDYAKVNNEMLREIKEQLKDHINNIGHLSLNPSKNANLKLEKQRNEFSSDSESEDSSDSIHWSDTNDDDESISSAETCPLVSDKSNSVKIEIYKSEDINLSQNEIVPSYVSPLSSLNRYNLRPRKSNASKDVSLNESISEFVTTVKLSEALSKLNRKNITQHKVNTINNVKPFFSSDDD